MTTCVWGTVPWKLSSRFYPETAQTNPRPSSVPCLMNNFCGDCSLSTTRGLDMLFFCLVLSSIEKNRTICKIIFTKTSTKIDLNEIRQAARAGCCCSTVEPSRVWADIGGLRGDCGDSLHMELIIRNVALSPIQFKELVKMWFSWKSYFNSQYLLSKFT